MTIDKIISANEMLKSKQIGYQEWVETILGVDYKNMYADDYLRRASNIVLPLVDNLTYDKADTSAIELAKEELIKERKKLQTVNLQAQEYYRESARADLLREQIKDAVESLEPISQPIVPNGFVREANNNVGLLVISDQHYDSNYELYGLNGEIVNEYNKDVFKARMWKLLDKMVSDGFEYDELRVVSLGDSLENILRMSSLTKLRQPVVKSAIEFANFMSTWLIEAYGRLNVPITFALVPGNHGVQRILSQKPELKEENIEYIIHQFIQCRLEDMREITVEPYSAVYVTSMPRNTMMFYHGEQRNLEEVIKYYENYYGVNIDYCYAGHYHSGSSKEIGVAAVVGAKKIIRVPSICGTDPYAVQCLKNSKAGAYFAIFNEDGEFLNKTYYLN